ncbi:uncharacterized protein LOC124295579 [Neodiprion lecontei]|uniref:Uncharacterized protein LOC124295579 n=1 Tax=Neodiprion lecontei TaxID=441921 RepID=A0ABM3GNX6_NEOLC|nr:uncharacterized protein LOC124295579 [Neodiprion lecontei]
MPWAGKRPRSSNLSVYQVALELRSHNTNHLIITGIRDGGDRERLDEILTKLLAALNIQLSPDAIIRFERMGRYRDQSAPGASTLRLDATAPGSPPAFTARPLLLILGSPAWCDRVIAAKKLKPQLRAAEIDAALSNRKVYINKRHPVQLHRYRSQILKKFPSLSPRLHRVDRRGRHGGGVAFFVHQKLCSATVATFAALPEDGYPEYLLIEVSADAGMKFLSAVVHRPPKVGHLDMFEDELVRQQSRYKFSCVLGDFNADLISAAYDSVHLSEFFASQGYDIVPMQPTHHTATSDTWLDICATNNINLLESWGQSSSPFLSGHDLMYAAVRYGVPKQEFALLPSMDERLSIFNNLTNKVLDCAVPVREFTLRRSPAPWISLDIRSLMKKRNACYQSFKRSRSVEVFAEYVAYRRDVKRALAAAKTTYIQEWFNTCGGARSFWREMENLGLAKCKKPPAALPSGITVDDLNEHFLSSTVTVRYDCPVVQNLAERQIESFIFSPITNRCVNSALSRITTRACGPDNLPIQAFKTLKDLLMPLIVYFLNSLLTTASVPLLWKSSIVVPIAKVRDPTGSSDFRPISLLCSLSEVLERIVYDQLAVHLARGNYLDPRQTGFREGMGTQSAVLRLVDDCRIAIDDRMVTLVVFLDFSKSV